MPVCSGIHERTEKSGVSLLMSGHGKTQDSVCSSVKDGRWT